MFRIKLQEPQKPYQDIENKIHVLRYWNTTFLLGQIQIFSTSDTKLRQSLEIRFPNMNFRTSSPPSFFFNKNKRSTDVIDAKCALNYQRGPPSLHFLYSLGYLEVYGVMYILCEWQRAMCCHLNLYEILRTAKASLINYLYTVYEGCRKLSHQDVLIASTVLN